MEEKTITEPLTERELLAEKEKNIKKELLEVLSRHNLTVSEAGQICRDTAKLVSKQKFISISL